MNSSTLDTIIDQTQIASILDRRKPDPLYQQIKSWMLQEMASGRWPLHYKLPAEENLARSLGVNRGTLRQAIQELISEHRLSQIHGKGTFVVSSQQVEGPLADHLTAFSEELILQHIPFRTEVLGQKTMIPEARINALLNLASGDDVLSLERRRFVNDAPIILTHNYVRLDLCPNIDQEDFTQQRLLSCLETKFGLHLSWARRTFEARAATAEQGQQLGIDTGTPLMYIEQIVYLEDGRPVECSDIWLAGDRFKMSSLITRDDKQTQFHPFRWSDFKAESTGQS